MISHMSECASRFIKISQTLLRVRFDQNLKMIQDPIENNIYLLTE